MNRFETKECQGSPLLSGTNLPVLNKHNTRIEQPPKPALWLYDNEDIEGWLKEEGIGYFDRQGIFQYGISPEELDETDVPDKSWGVEN
jgi:hypothetical protein